VLKKIKKEMDKNRAKISRYQHTNDRLKELKILKLEDELKIAEIKIIWRWDKKKIPHGLKNIISETTGAALRNRKFNRPISWKYDSIAYRIATRANKERKEIEIARSKKGLAKKYKSKIILTEYNSICRTRNCLDCTQNQNN
jgi:hypothetical protein